MGTGYPVLTPTYGLGSYGRTAAAVLIGGPRNKIGNQNRIYYWFKKRGQGAQYQDFLLKVLGNQPTYRNAWSVIQ